MMLGRVFETVLYATDLERAMWFYRDVLGLDLVVQGGPLLAFRLSTGVLLIFNPELSAAEGRALPAHGAHGPGHIAFGATEDEIVRWIDHLRNVGVEIELVCEWEEGDRSVYVRDPAGNSVEFAPPTLWGGGWDF